MIKFTTVCNNNYIIYCKKLLKSLIKNEFNYPFIIFCDNNFSEENKSDLKNIYENITFYEIDKDKYLKHNKKNIKYYSIESFNIEADRVIFLDGDMICLRNINGLIDYDYNLGMVKENKRPSYNAGLISIGKEYLNKKTYNDLLNVDYTNIKTYGTDQKIYNNFFRGKIQNIPSKYNVLISEINFSNFNDIVFLHYIYKPNLKVGKIHLTKEFINLWEKI